MKEPTVLIVPGLRDHVDAHWQTLLARELAARGHEVRSVPPMGRDDLDCARRVEAIDRALAEIPEPPIVVAHSGGVIMFAHWARTHDRPIRGALLATPPDFERPMPDGYPIIEALRAGGWLPVPREPLPFPSVVAASRNDPLGRFERVAELARAWGSRLDDIGLVGHLNPASGFGAWPQAETYVAELAALRARAEQALTRMAQRAAIY
ncbi:MAG TPA: alpha/beta hydrolase [Rhodanobacteraceae bacterium]|nr:alpha/beta hydrolase [Rhodanobacteraceae bacterium]